MKISELQNEQDRKNFSCDHSRQWRPKQSDRWFCVWCSPPRLKSMIAELKNFSVAETESSTLAVTAPAENFSEEETKLVEEIFSGLGPMCDRCGSWTWTETRRYWLVDGRWIAFEVKERVCEGCRHPIALERVLGGSESIHVTREKLRQRREARFAGSQKISDQ